MKKGLEDEIRELFEEAAAPYTTEDGDIPDGAGPTGAWLGAKLTALQAAILRLAKAIDEEH